jgi:hypothetical protein
MNPMKIGKRRNELRAKKEKERNDNDLKEKRRVSRE